MPSAAYLDLYVPNGATLVITWQLLSTKSLYTRMALLASWVSYANIFAWQTASLNWRYHICGSLVTACPDLCVCVCDALFRLRKAPRAPQLTGIYRLTMQTPFLVCRIAGLAEETFFFRELLDNLHAKPYPYLRAEFKNITTT